VSCKLTCDKHDEHVYTLCYGRPTLVKDRDHITRDPIRDYPITHYVGFTTRQPIVRIREHGAHSIDYVIDIQPGTELQEEGIKLFQNCSQCGGSLFYYSESPGYVDTWRAKIEDAHFAKVMRNMPIEYH
jgi:hypothetical protein